MHSYEIREYFIDDPELPKLFLQSWARSDLDAIGCLLITHGISEHSECYDHLAKALADHGWMVFGWDLQGHGRSQGKRGYVKEFDHFARDLGSVIQKLKQDDTLPTSRFHLFGHSMGGLISLQFMINNPSTRVNSLILSNPCLGLAIPVPKIKEIASHWLKQFWPTLTLDNEVRYHYLSRDPEMVASYEKDPLRHGKISAPLFLGMVEAINFVKNNIRQLKVPCYFQVAGKDQLVDPQASLDLYKLLDGTKKLTLYEDSFHEIYNDLNKQEAIDDLINYLAQS